MTKSVYVFDLNSPYPGTDKLPDSFRLFAYGTNRAYKLGEGDKEIPFNQNDAQKLVAAFMDAGVDLLIDYEHQSLDGHTGPKAAAGWIKALEMRDDGLYATQVEWTPHAMEMLKAKEYRYFSPAVEYDESGEMCRMLPAALTNLPALKQINALMNNIITQAKDKTMSDEKVETLNAAEILSQAKAMKEEIERLKKEKQDLEVNSILDKAVESGRLAPAKRAELFGMVETVGVNGLKMIVNAMPTVLPTPAAQAHSVETKTDELSAVEKQLARTIGVSFEQFAVEKKATVARLSVSKGLTDVAYSKNALLDRTIDDTKSKAEARKLTVLSAARSSMNLTPDQVNLGYAVNKQGE